MPCHPATFEVPLDGERITTPEKGHTTMTDTTNPMPDENATADDELKQYVQDVRAYGEDAAGDTPATESSDDSDA
jgi:hypothetical protein